MGTQDVVLQIAKQHGIDEVMVIYSSRVETKEWVAAKAAWEKGNARQPLSPEKARLLLKDWGECALVVGTDSKNFSEKLLAIEQALHQKGYYKAWAVLNEPLEKCEKRPCMEWLAIDIVSTLARYKKNLKHPVPGDYPPWGIILVG